MIASTHQPRPLTTSLATGWSRILNWRTLTFMTDISHYSCIIIIIVLFTMSCYGVEIKKKSPYYRVRAVFTDAFLKLTICTSLGPVHVISLVHVSRMRTMPQGCARVPCADGRPAWHQRFIFPQTLQPTITSRPSLFTIHVATVESRSLSHAPCTS